MTILGKMLVFVNLIFSLVTGALIVMVFAKQTNWKYATDRWKEEYTVALKDAQTYADDIDKLRNEKDKEIQTAKLELDKLKKQLAASRDDLAKLQKDFADQQNRSRANDAVSTGAMEQMNRLTAEVKDLQDLVTKRDAKIVDLEKQSQKFRDEMVAAQIRYSSEHDRLERQTEAYRILSKEMEAAKTKLAGTTPGVTTLTVAKPPPEDVEGLVVASDPKTGLVTISIGSDSGVNRGHTLEVFRFKPKPEYVGMIRIVDSRAHEAVGRAILPLRAGPIRKGDQVSSNILGRK